MRSIIEGDFQPTLLVRLVIKALFLLAVCRTSSGITQQTIDLGSIDRQTYDALWAAHASYQSRIRQDMLTPVLVRAVIAERSANPAASYDDLLKKALSLRDEYSQQKQYADNGRLPDPFDRQRELIDWLDQIAAIKKDPFLETVAKSSRLALKLGTTVLNTLTSLDDTQALELKDILYQNAFKNLDATFLEAAKLADDPKLKSALNTLLGSALGVLYWFSAKMRERRIAGRVDSALRAGIFKA